MNNPVDCSPDAGRLLVGVTNYLYAKEEVEVAKKKIETGRIITKIMAGFLAVIMVLGVALTLIYYLVTM